MKRAAQVLKTLLRTKSAMTKNMNVFCKKNKTKKTPRGAVLNVSVYASLRRDKIIARPTKKRRNESPRGPE